MAEHAHGCQRGWLLYLAPAARLQARGAGVPARLTVSLHSVRWRWVLRHDGADGPFSGPDQLAAEVSQHTRRPRAVSHGWDAVATVHKRAPETAMVA
jgi:hypothetical protein